MSNAKYLAKNIGLLALSQFGTRLLSFFLVPLYTRILTTEEYGTYDLFNTTIALFIPFLTLNIKEASLRFALDQTKERQDIFSISLNYCLRAIICAVALLSVNSIFGLSPVINDYKWFVLALFITNILNGVISNFARGIDYMRDIAISGVLCTTVIIGLNIVTLLPLHMGLTGYFLANIIGSVAQSIYLFVRFRGWKYMHGGRPNFALKKEMTDYSKPLIANGVAWWINSVSDRYIIIWLCGLAENGIYSVANKIPTILDVFQGIFSQAWTLSAVRDYQSADKTIFFTKMFQLYNFGMTCMCSFLIIFSRVLAGLLYAKEFYTAWRYVPFLMLAVLFGALAGYIGGIFSAAKASKEFAYSTIIGAVLNLVLNLLFVRRIGALGAAIATAICYFVIYMIRVINVKKFIELAVSWSVIILQYVVLTVQSVLLFMLDESVLFYVLQGILLFFILLSSREQILYLKAKIFVNIRKRN